MNISVIIPAYNAEDTIERCLNAVLNQTYPKENFEVVVVNDGSQDRTAEILSRKESRSTAKEYSLRVIHLGQNQGRIIARETGAEEAKFQVLLFVDARILLSPDFMEQIKTINYLPLFPVGKAYKYRSWIDTFFFCIRRRVYGKHLEKMIYDEGKSPPEPSWLTIENFDKTPSATSCFAVPRDIFLHASSSVINKDKFAEEEYPLLRAITELQPFLCHPNLKVEYLQRFYLIEEIVHIFERGIRFVDKNIFFPKYLVPFVVASIVFALFIYFIIISGSRGLLLDAAVFIVILVGASLYFAENLRDFLRLIILLPILGGSFYTGILYGFLRKLRSKF